MTFIRNLCSYEKYKKAIILTISQLLSKLQCECLFNVNGNQNHQKKFKWYWFHVSIMCEIHLENICTKGLITPQKEFCQIRPPVFTIKKCAWKCVKIKW